MVKIVEKPLQILIRLDVVEIILLGGLIYFSPFYRGFFLCDL